jgi:hypothetical protein
MLLTKRAKLRQHRAELGLGQIGLVAQPLDDEPIRLSRVGRFQDVVRLSACWAMCTAVASDPALLIVSSAMR